MSDYFSAHQKAYLSNTGFKDQFNYKNHGIENNMYGIGITHINTNNASVYGATNVKYFIPKGTGSVSLTIQGDFQKVTNTCAALIRFGQPPIVAIPPSYDYFLYPENHTDYFPAKQYPDPRTNLMTAVHLEDLVEKDYFVCNSGGYIFVVDRQGDIRNYTGWIYIKIIPYGAAYDRVHMFNLYLDETQYPAWYSSAKWGTDGDPSELGTPITTGDLTSSATSLDFGTVYLT